MLYLINARDVENSLEKRAKARPDHIKRLEQMQNEGRLILAGPLPNVDSETPGDAGFSGSIIIAEFDNLDAAKAWANDDPYVHGGVYDQVEVKPFKKVFPS